MKALLVESDNGLEYDSYDHWISAVYLVPDDFNPKEFYDNIVKKAKSSKLIRIRKNGGIYLKDSSKINKMLHDDLKSRFQSLEMVEF